MLRKSCYVLISFLIVFQSLGISCYAQDSANTIGRVAISSPNAASLGKYGDIPVGYHTGIPDINIPFYTVNAGDLSLPISISYHASGLKVQEQASWVGAGWSLIAGGMITRTVRGAADDRGYNNGYVTNGYYTDSGYYNYSFHPVSDGGVNSTAHTNWTSPDDDQFVANRKDGEPDMYTFNFSGHSGKFYFNDDQTAMIVPEEDLKIQADYAAGTGFRGFIVTSSDGAKYYFGKTGNNGSVDPVETTFFITTQNTYGLAGKVASSWFLNKVVSADGIDSILLNYQAENYSYYNISMFPVYYQPSGQSIQYVGTWASYPYEYDVEKNFISGVRLSSITFPNGTVTFNAGANARTDLGGYSSQTMTDQINTEAKPLGNIQISDNGNFCKKYNFYYNYFYDNVTTLNGGLFQAYPNLNTINTDKYRLRLDSVQEVSCDGTINLPPYKFSYFSEAVPRKLSFGIDHWGFYNGITTNNTLLPTSRMITDNSLFTWNGANRDATWPAMRGGGLQQINYPMGGYSKFEFEANTTYGPLTTVTYTSSFTMSNGFDGNQTNPKLNTWTTPSLGSTFYQIILQSSQTAGTGGSFEIRDQSNTLMQSVNVSSGGTDTAYVLLSPNTLYNIVFYNNFIQSGHGINVYIYAVATSVSNSNITVGGLRIKSIVNNDALTALNDTTYFGYNFSNNPAGNSSGILYSRPVYIQVIRNDIINTVWGAFLPGGCGNPGNSNKGFYRSPSSLRPMATTMGNHIGYNEVYVRKPNNGYTVYRYYGSQIWDNSTQDIATTTIFNNNYCDVNIPNYPSAPVPYDPMVGQLKYEGDYNQNSQLIKDIWYLPEYLQNPIPTPGHIAFQNQVMSSYTDYSLYTFRMIKNRVVTTNYIPSIGSISDSISTYYGSKFHHQVTRAVEVTSLGDSTATNYKYAFDIRANCDAIPDSLAYYNSSVNSAIQTFNTAASTCTPQTTYSPVTNCRWPAFINLRYDLSVARIKYMKYLKQSYSNSNSVFNTCHASAKSAAGAELKPILEMQDFFQNPVVEQNQWKNANLLRSNFTRYDYASNPAGKVYPQKTQLINLAIPSASFVNAVVSGTSLTKDSRYLDESFYNFNGGNQFQFTSHDGVTKSYIWDYQSTKPIAEVSGSAVDKIAYTSFEAEGKGSWTYSGTPVTDSTTITGVKDYILTGSNNPSRSGLSSTTTYIVSYWTKNASAFTISGTIAGYPISGRSVSGWKYFEHQVTGQTTISIGGTGSIDELRLYPVGSLMETYTYTPLLGINNKCDENNRVTYYVYDKLGRLQLIKDQDRNILKKICYNFQTQLGCDVITYYNVQKSGNFIKNNCSAGYSGTMVTYNVAANAYTSYVSQADADQLAQNDVNSNGQAYANINGSCVLNVTIQGYNTKTSDYDVVFTNNSTGVGYTFRLTQGTFSPSTLGTIPIGTYLIQFQPRGIPVTATFHILSFSQTGTSAVFSNISISSTSTAFMN